MDESPAQSISRKDVLYRLGMLLDVPWNLFKGLELWEIANRAFMAGEAVVERKIERLDALVSARSVSASKEAGRVQQEFEEYYRKAITVETPLNAREREQNQRAHNQAFFDFLSND